MSDTLAIVPVTGSGSAKRTDTFVGAAGTYEILTFDGKPLLATELWKLYVAKLPSGQIGFMKIAVDPVAGNETLEREAAILRTLQEVASSLDSEATAAGQTAPFFGIYSPTVLETLTTPDAQKRFVMMLGFNPVISTYRQLIPLSVATRDKRVDLRTTVWMAAKAFKFLDYAHSMGFGIGAVDSTNALLETALHGIFFLDFARASEEVTDEEALQEVSNVARMVWNAAGGSDTTPPPHDAAIMSKADYDRYVALLRQIITEPKPAGEQQEELYALADSIWPKEPIVGLPGRMKRHFHPWAVYPR